MSAPYLQFDHEKIGKRLITNAGCVIGRGEDCNIRIPHKGVSTRHAEIVRHNGQYWIRDLGSTNGTHVDGSMCHDQIPLRDGARLRLGRFSATFVAPEAVVAQAPTASTPRTARPAKNTRRKQASINPLWAAVALVACCGITFVVIDRMRSDEPTEVEQVAKEEPKKKKTKPKEPDSPFSALGKLDDRPEEERVVSSTPNKKKTDTPTKKKTEARKVEKRPERPPGDTGDGDDRGTPNKESKPVTDPLDVALRGGNALEIASAARRHSNKQRRTEVLERLAEEPIYCLHRSGLLGGGEEVLLSAFGFHCAPGEKKEVIERIRGCRVEEWKLTIRFTQDYTKGLGRKMGSYRMPPHPKKVTIELTPINAARQAWKVEVETPRLELKDEGYTEEEVWAMTLDPLLAELRRQLQ